MNSSIGTDTTNVVLGVLPPPPGVAANFVNPESISWKLVDTLIVGIAISTPICLLRLYTSRWIVGRFHLDDGKCGRASLDGHGTLTTILM